MKRRRFMAGAAAAVAIAVRLMSDGSVVHHSWHPIVDNGVNMMINPYEQ